MSKIKGAFDFASSAFGIYSDIDGIFAEKSQEAFQAKILLILSRMESKIDDLNKITKKINLTTESNSYDNPIKGINKRYGVIFTEHNQALLEQQTETSLQKLDERLSSSFKSMPDSEYREVVDHLESLHQWITTGDGNNLPSLWASMVVNPNQLTTNLDLMYEYFQYSVVGTVVKASFILANCPNEDLKEMISDAFDNLQGTNEREGRLIEWARNFEQVSREQAEPFFWTTLRPIGKDPSSCAGINFTPETDMYNLPEGHVITGFDIHTDPTNVSWVTMVHGKLNSNGAVEKPRVSYQARKGEAKNGSSTILWFNTKGRNFVDYNTIWVPEGKVVINMKWDRSSFNGKFGQVNIVYLALLVAPVNEKFEINTSKAKYIISDTMKQIGQQRESWNPNDTPENLREWVAPFNWIHSAALSVENIERRRSPISGVTLAGNRICFGSKWREDKFHNGLGDVKLQNTEPAL